MTTFDEREKAFEEKFKHDQELRFKVHARRNKLLGLWAAARMGLAGAEAEAYARAVVEADFQAPGEDDVCGKVVKDLNAKGISADAAQVRAEMERLLLVARDQIAKG
jgi:hypothetical protein